jgi:hypothetical protein
MRDITNFLCTVPISFFQATFILISLMEEPGLYHIAHKPWLIVHRLSATEQKIICRFRNRNDADGYLTVLRRLMPDADLKVVFEPPPKS